ncbi:HAD family hydrolase [Zunongwangia endophytica]|uniref:HAD family hydrolase n=1 Tax=Zunongwangia endophytica TaxID=1808945 RepID=A0ABV8H4Z3_9FLAO|nr:HAD family phosphatase [Zunongwangia endophytica]MDN3596574.1 HAD family phosphatase [Zunongwangia endophytica]
MAEIKAAIFDFDGTLVDSEHYHFKSWTEVLKEYDVDLDYDYYIKTYAGTPSPINAKAIIEQFDLPISREDLTYKRERMAEKLVKESEVEFMPFAIETLELFKKKGIPIYLVTGSPRNNVEFLLEKTGIDHYFEFTITRTDVKNSKPDPESYLTAIEKINLPKQNMIVFEDTKTGVASAKGAGLECLAIQADANLKDNVKAADKIFDTLQEATQYLEKEGRI